MTKLQYITLIFFFHTTTFASIEKLNQLDIISLYKKARSNNPSLKRVNLEVDFQSARLKELKTAFYPTLSFQGTYFYGNVALAREENRSGLDRIDDQNAINLNTTLYGGGAEYTYFKYKKILPALAKNQKESAYFEFFLQLNALYFNYKNLINQREFIKKQVKSLKTQTVLLKKWSKIGRARNADYLSTLTQLKSLEGRVQEISENITSARLNLKAMTGVELSLDNTPLKMSAYSDIPRGFDFKSRPQYQALEMAIENQLQNITIEKSNLKPQLDFNSNYYINRRIFGRQDDWDVSLQLRWSFFDFNATNSRVEQQRIRLRQLQHDLKMSEININNEMKVVSNQFKSQLKRKDFLRESYEVSLQNYNEQNKEFKKGLIDALDLNRALDQLLQAQLAYESMKYSLAERWYALSLISGDIQL